MSDVPNTHYIRNLGGDFDRATGLPEPKKTLGEIVSKFEELRAEFKQASVYLQRELDRLAAAVLDDEDSPDVYIFRRMRNLASLRCKELHKLMEAKKAEIATLEYLQRESATRVEAAEAAVLAHDQATAAKAAVLARDQATAAKALTRSKRKMQVPRVAGLGHIEAGAANWGRIQGLVEKTRKRKAPVVKEARKEMHKEESEKK